LSNDYHFHLQNLRAAFYKFDDDHNGLINKENFRRILDSFMCIMSDNEFEILCKKLGSHITKFKPCASDPIIQYYNLQLNLICVEVKKQMVLLLITVELESFMNRPNFYIELTGEMTYINKVCHCIILTRWVTV
jgi:hypothetical protein